MQKLLISGATGNVGSYVVQFLEKQNDFEVIAAISRPESAKRIQSGIKTVILDFEKPETFENALNGISGIFLMRPPHISKTKTTFEPFIKLAREKGVRHIVFLSLVGVENNKIVPHYKIEQYILASGISYTFLRAGFFMQNLNTTHVDDIKTLRSIILPAGKGKTSFVDTRDLAEVAALALTNKIHENKKYNLTGDKALTYFDIAKILSQELNVKIDYKPVSVFAFYRHMKKQNHKMVYIIVVTALYFVTKMGKAGNVYPDIYQLLQRPPISFEQYAKDFRQYFYENYSE